MENGNKNAKAWIPFLMERLHTQTAKKLAKEIIKTGINDWWFKYVHPTKK
jgi:hypothetical protein